MQIRRTTQTTRAANLFQDSASSQEAQTIGRETDEAVRRIRPEGFWVAVSQLIDSFEECGHQGWDGHDAEAVGASTFAHARDFLFALPNAFPTPEVSACDDGTIAFDWFPGPRSLFSVSVTDQGNLIFAAVTPSGRMRGVERFEDQLPEVISEILRRLF